MSKVLETLQAQIAELETEKQIIWRVNYHISNGDFKHLQTQPERLMAKTLLYAAYGKALVESDPDVRQVVIEHITRLIQAG